MASGEGDGSEVTALSSLDINLETATVNISLKTTRQVDLEGLELAYEFPENVEFKNDECVEIAKLSLPIQPFSAENPPPNVTNLFEWFSRILAEDNRAVLEFSPSLTREIRAQLLNVAKNQGDAEQIWNWIKAEANDLSNLTKVDIQEMIANRNMSDEVLALVIRHESADRLCTAAAEGDRATVDDILSVDPSILHVTSKQKNQLALHAACLGAGSPSCSPAEMVDYLLQVGARVNEPDGYGRSAMAICRQDGFGPSIRSVIDVLERNGGREIGLVKPRAGQAPPGMNGRGVPPKSRGFGGPPPPAGGILSAPTDNWRGGNGAQMPSPGAGGYGGRSPGPAYMERRDPGILTNKPGNNFGSAPSGGWRNGDMGSRPAPANDQNVNWRAAAQSPKGGQFGLLAEPREEMGGNWRSAQGQVGRGSAPLQKGPQVPPENDWRAGGAGNAAGMNRRGIIGKGPAFDSNTFEVGDRENELAKIRGVAADKEAAAAAEKMMTIPRGRAVVDDEDYEEMDFRPVRKL
ncbi:hypothetical protein GUITHDRAFT_139837 [Guillardia theta CCMP2712]|uniref:Uncharacterized protein n=1 Tax=Guillardia theta (strain CCMP2712) TaxID=905079 RepID=L1J7K9_GUITC|nr:hypothetical protein GUITHDRAFT_139837 [Guillardia theta CCMP2712]EKX44287.1 hypothetical protein GUITHDRAFT_139837 [Guillardia theta CCMP2712]|eukprot:XP_005831267.1 hypothetical protein GUITHDRAFT_139837 [Guillardia theta CCMP2712]